MTISSKETIPLTTRFDGAIKRLGPFEQCPKVAVALSGGSDSLCLTLLLQDWIRKRKGTLIALTVDHGLRQESAQETKLVHTWMNQLGIEHHILQWQGEKPNSRIQEKARNARYQLLENWCHSNGILHLFFGHNAEDQNETTLFRLLRGSGIDGLAGMSALVEKKYLRILRPLLNVSRETLRQKLSDQNQQWIDDPSNSSPKYTRARLRNMLEQYVGENMSEGISPVRVNALSRCQGLGRIALEQGTHHFLAKAVQVFPEGYALLNPKYLDQIPQDTLMRALSWILMTIGGKSYPPRTNQLKCLHQQVFSGNNSSARTCWGCIVLKRRDRVLFVRESGRIAQQVPLNSDLRAYWDHRFVVCWPSSLTLKQQPLRVAKLGEKGWQQVVTLLSRPLKQRVPASAGYALPAIWKGDVVKTVPHLKYGIDLAGAYEDWKSWIFEPERPMGPPEFMIA
ncbi:MAG: tRNA lysidine(34) synthetase TilS [Pseudomonadota bacterium]